MTTVRESGWPARAVEPASAITTTAAIRIELDMSPPRNAPRCRTKVLLEVSSATGSDGVAGSARRQRARLPRFLFHDRELLPADDLPDRVQERVVRLVP